MAKDGVLYAVDPFERGRLGFSIQRVIAMREVGQLEGGRVEWVRMPGHSAAGFVSPSGKVDFIFIDGDHSWDGISSDWLAWSNLVSIDGIVALHDSVSSATREITQAGSVRFTREVVRTDPRFMLVETVDTLTVWRRHPVAAESIEQ